MFLSGGILKNVLAFSLQQGLLYSHQMLLSACFIVFLKHEFFVFEENSVLSEKDNTFVFGNEGDQKNLHSGGRNFSFLINLIEFLK